MSALSDLVKTPVVGPWSKEDLERTILVLGDGNFQHTEALVEHEKAIDQEFTRHLESSEFKSQSECYVHEGVKPRLTELGRQGVKISFEVDARKIHETYAERTIRHIIFNCPDVNAGGGADKTAELVHDFFQSASKLQGESGFVHLNLIQPEDDPEACIYYQHEKYGIVQASQKAGYNFEGHFNPLPYQHQKTEGFREVPSAKTGLRHFVFSKVNSSNPLNEEFIREGSYSHKKREGQTRGSYFEDRPIELHYHFSFKEGEDDACNTCFPNIVFVAPKKSAARDASAPRAGYFYYSSSEDED